MTARFDPAVEIALLVRGAVFSSDRGKSYPEIAAEGASL